MPQDDVPFQPVRGTVCYGHDLFGTIGTRTFRVRGITLRPDQAGNQVANYITSNCGGVYRLVGLAGRCGNSPAQLNRVCGIDETGTLYIGRTSDQRALQTRLGNLFRTMRARKGLAYSGHSAAEFLRHHPILSARFPLDCAVSWSYDHYDVMAEQSLLARYVRSFEEAPPLNLQRGLV
jgi:hypothetical protein